MIKFLEDCLTGAAPRKQVAGAPQFPIISMLTIEDFGGWDKAQKDHFADGGSFNRIQDEVLRIGSGVMTDVLGRAARRGEAPGELAPRVATLPVDLFRHELLVTRALPTDEAVHEIVDGVFLPLVGRGVT